MKPVHRIRRWLFAPLVYLAALLLLLEDWLWDLGARLMSRIATWPPLHKGETWLRSLRPAAALAVFMLPALLLFPVKLLALFAIARGHAVLGVLAIVLAKLGGAAAVARIYLLTRPTLLTIRWFAATLGWFLPQKERWIARLKASAAWHQLGALRHTIQHAMARWSGRGRAPGGGRASWRGTRILRRFAARFAAMRRSRRD
jgi:hypothetical protein